MFSTCPFVRPSVRPFVTKLMNTIFWKRKNRFGCKLAHAVHEARNKMINFGCQKVKGQDHTTLEFSTGRVPKERGSRCRRRRVGWSVRRGIFRPHRGRGLVWSISFLLQLCAYRLSFPRHNDLLVEDMRFFSQFLCTTVSFEALARVVPL